MQVYARLRNLRIAPRKVRLVVNLIRGLSVDAALQQLAFNPKAASEPVMKLLKSAMANAEHNFHADVSTLRIAKITADAGQTLKRSRARAHGSSAPIRKRMSNVAIILSDESIADVHKSQGVGRRAQGVVKKEEETSKEESKKKSEKGTKAKGEKRVKKTHAPRPTPHAPIN